MKTKQIYFIFCFLIGLLLLTQQWSSTFKLRNVAVLKCIRLLTGFLHRQARSHYKSTADPEVVLLGNFTTKALRTTNGCFAIWQRNNHLYTDKGDGAASCTHTDLLYTDFVRSIYKHVCIMGVDRGQHVNESSKMKHLIIICKQVNRLIGVD